MLITNITTMVRLWDPIFKKEIAIDSATYWSYEIKALAGRSKLSPFIVLKVFESNEYEAKETKKKRARDAKDEDSTI